MLYHIPHNPHIVKQHDWFVNATKIVSAWASTFRISQLRKGTLSCFSLSKPPPSQTQHVGSRPLQNIGCAFRGWGKLSKQKHKQSAMDFLCGKKNQHSTSTSGVGFFSFTLCNSLLLNMTIYSGFSH